MYPWEKPPQKPEAEAQAPGTTGTELEEDFPWSARSAIQVPPAELEEPEFSEREEQLVQSMLASARKQARIGELEHASLLDYTSDEPETDWRPLIGVALAAVCLGGLGFWLTRPQPQTVVTRVPVPTASKAPQPPPPAVEEPSALQDATIQPTDTRAVVARALREGGRSNPFLSELPPPIPAAPPTSPAPEPKASPPPPPPPPPEPSLRLVSIATSRSDRIALIQVSGSGTPYLQEVSVGDRVVGWQVKGITSEKIVLSKGKKSQTLSAQ
ncbi:MAG: hypothetical protein H7Y22_01705 [Gemmatimonadaceae bacterium]|nr:hypothetical protein [Gloeobacterales cyanobacterium ES-bin-141]